MHTSLYVRKYTKLNAKFIEHERVYELFLIQEWHSLPFALLIPKMSYFPTSFTYQGSEITREDGITLALKTSKNISEVGGEGIFSCEMFSKSSN